ncbi:1688_t:CDS:2, partial [Racocetra persica]
ESEKVDVAQLSHDLKTSSTDMISVTNCHAHVTEPSQENDQDKSKTRSSASSELPEAK